MIANRYNQQGKAGVGNRRRHYQLTLLTPLGLGQDKHILLRVDQAGGTPERRGCCLKGGTSTGSISLTLLPRSALVIAATISTLMIAAMKTSVFNTGANRPKTHVEPTLLMYRLTRALVSMK